MWREYEGFLVSKHAMQEQARLVKFLAQNSLSAPTQVFEECGVCGVQNTPIPWKWKFGQDLGLWVLSSQEHPLFSPLPPSVWILTAVSPTDTVSFSFCQDL